MPSSDPPTGQPETSVPSASTPPLPSNSEPLTLACQCLNITVEARVPDTILDRVAKGPTAFKAGETDRIYLPAGAETIREAVFATFERDTTRGRSGPSGQELSWRKCWVCSTRVYAAKGVDTGDTAPAEQWVDVAFADGVVFGARLEETNARTRLPYTGLALDLPDHSTFGRPPVINTVQPYGGPEAPVLLPPVQDPFFLPPPFMPSHPYLHDLCKAAVTSLNDKHDKIEREIGEYIAARNIELRRIEDQTRAEVETLWNRYIRGPGAGEVTDRRRGSIAPPASSSRSPSRSRVAFDTAGSKPAAPAAAESSAPVSVPPPASRATGATGTASLLSASLSANAFHAPPPRAARNVNEDEFDQLTKTVSNEPSESRMVAMSMAFQTIEEHMGAAAAASSSAHRRKAEAHREARLEKQEEEQKEDEKEGVDSWIGLERAQERRRVEANIKEEHAETSAANGEGSRERKGKVTFQEPSKERRDSKKEEEEEDEVYDAGNDDDGGCGVASPLTADGGDVFDFEDDTPKPPVDAAPVETSAQASRIRTMVDNDLSRTFAADAPSHRAAWRKFEANDSIANVLRQSSGRRRSSSEDEDEDEPDLGLARSMPVAIVNPRALAKKVEHGHKLQRKTSLTDRTGMIVPELISAMRERPERRDSAEDVPPVGGRTMRSSSIAISGSVLGPGLARRNVSGEREREQVKSYRADPGAVFESLADRDESESEDEDATPQTNGASRFVPPHVIVQRDAAKAKMDPDAWRSLAS
ncbi:hypothetical protein Q8F55_001152 [Vanrija albida]|uniref:Uncharacterized protein n=1 Tax=Vanrija albida TaxID=181172 RepID=A0ABR3QFF8_9TREE